jgi:hypothetical protein
MHCASKLSVVGQRKSTEGHQLPKTPARILKISKLCIYVGGKKKQKTKKRRILLPLKRKMEKLSSNILDNFEKELGS